MSWAQRAEELRKRATWDSYIAITLVLAVATLMVIIINKVRIH
jgi:hypothetical protein